MATYLSPKEAYLNLQYTHFYVELLNANPTKTTIINLVFLSRYRIWLLPVPGPGLPTTLDSSVSRGESRDWWKKPVNRDGNWRREGIRHRQQDGSSNIIYVLLVFLFVLKCFKSCCNVKCCSVCFSSTVTETDVEREYVIVNKMVLVISYMLYLFFICT